MRMHVGIGMSVVVLSACAGTRSAPAPAPASSACAAYDVDRAWLRRGPVYQPCNVDEPATAIQRAPTGYRPLDCKPASATLLLVVDATGVPEPRAIRVVQSTAEDFARAAINALRRWRFSPAVKDGKKVRQVTQQRFDFQCQQVGLAPSRRTS